jgi:hypothetical protein
MIKILKIPIIQDRPRKENKIPPGYWPKTNCIFMLRLFCFVVCLYRLTPIISCKSYSEKLKINKEILFLTLFCMKHVHYEASSYLGTKTLAYLKHAFTYHILIDITKEWDV